MALGKILGIVAIPMALLACNEPPRRLGEDELVRIAADYVVRNDVTVHIARSEPDRVHLENYPQIPYRDGKALMRANAGCCFLGQTPSDSAPASCLGAAHDVVTVRYRQRYRDNSNDVAEQTVVRNISINRAGMVCTED